MKPSSITSTSLRVILSILLVLLVAAGVGVFLLGYKQVKNYSAESQTVAAKAQASQSSLEHLVTTKKFLAENKSAVERANQLVSESKSYVYQDQIIADINKYASEAGLAVTNISFADTKTAKVGSSSSTSSPTTATTAKTSTASAPAGVKSMTATVSLKNPVNYDAMLNFIHLVEQSLFRMQISQISLSQSQGDQGGLTSDILTIEVYVR